MKKSYRYPGTKPFSFEDRNIFFGRKGDIQQLTQLIGLEQLVVLFGKSGLGKTSLINAGILPKVKESENYKPFYIRYGRYLPDASSEKSLIQTTVEKIFPSTHFNNILGQFSSKEENLWYYFKCLNLENPSNDGYILFFDQFEEVFSYPEEQILEFRRQLSELLFIQLPQQYRQELRAVIQQNKEQVSREDMSKLYDPMTIKVVMAIRSDRLSLLYRFKDFFPNILQVSYELTPLSNEAAREAIVLPAAATGAYYSPKFSYTSKAIEKIIRFLSKEGKRTIESFQLQIICEYIERQIVNENLTKIEKDHLGNLENLLENYYDIQISQIGNQEEQEKARELIEDGLIFSEDQQRLSLYEKQIYRDFDISAALLKRLVDCRLLRAEISTTGIITYEISHDTLVGPILISKQKRLETQKKKIFAAYEQELQHKEELIQQFSSRKDNNKELSELNDLIESGGSDFYAFIRRGNIYLDNRDYQKALLDYQKAVELNPNNYMGYYNLGITYHELNNLDLAIEEYSKALKFEPDNADIYNNRGIIYKELSRYKLAQKDYEKALEVDDRYANAFYNLGLVKIETESLEAAIAEFEKAIDVKPYYLDAINWKGVCLLRLNKYEEALGEFKKCVDYDPAYYFAHYNMGTIYENLNQEDLAFEAYSSAITANPNYDKALSARGVLLYNRGKYWEAIKDYQQAIELAPNTPANYYNLGLAQKDLGQYEDSISSFNKAIKLNSEYVDAINWRGVIYYRLGKNKEALADYNRALELDPNYQYAYNNRGLVHQNNFDFDLALDDFTEALRLFPNDVKALVNRGYVHYEIKEYEKGIPDFESALQLSPNYEEAYFGLGACLYYTEDYEQSLRYFNKVVELNPANAIAYNNRAACLRKLGHLEAAKENVRKSLELDESDGFTYATLALIEGDMGNTDKFYENLEIAITRPTPYPLHDEVHREASYKDYLGSVRLEELVEQSRNDNSPTK